MKTTTKETKIYNISFSDSNYNLIPYWDCGESYDIYSTEDFKSEEVTSLADYMRNVWDAKYIRIDSNHILIDEYLDRYAK